jgi:hypothetical protein
MPSWIRVNIIRTVIALGAMSAALGCNRAAEPPARAAVDEAAVAHARETVETYYRALASNDCEATRTLTGNAELDCVEAFSDYQEHGSRLVEIVDVTRDGRDPAAYIVRARMQRGDRERENLIRTEHRDGQWTVRM